MGAVTGAVPIWALHTGFIINRFGVLTYDHRTVTAGGVIIGAAIGTSFVVCAARGAYQRWGDFIFEVNLCAALSRRPRRHD